MELKVSEKEKLFNESRESIQEVTGWKMFIFLPQSTVWKFFLICTIIIKCIYNFTRAFYMKAPFLFTYVDNCCDFFYSADAVLSLLHYCMRNTRKLRFGNKRNPLLLMIDFLSIVPLETLYKLTIYEESEKHQRLAYSLNLIGILRIYQLPVNFSSIKDSICRAKIYVIVTVFQVLSYSLILTYFLSCFTTFYLEEKIQQHCRDNLLTCTSENFVQTYYLLGQSYVQPFLKYDLEKCKALLLVDFILGYLFTYGFVTPMFLFVSIKFLDKYFEYARKLRHVKVLTGNFIQDKKTKKRVLEYFYELWTFGRCDKHPELLQLFPLCFRKNIFCDMHWDAMRHSYLMRELSIGCKRSLALSMRTEFLLPNTRIFEKHVDPAFFLYLESGVLHIMAEENNMVPVLSLSGGTIWGELALFFFRHSIATTYTGKFSVIHTVDTRKFFCVLKDYPQDRKSVFIKLRTRMALARSMYEIKKKISMNVALTKSKSLDFMLSGNLKWIKSQYRAISHLEEIEKLLAMHQCTPDDYERQVLKLNIQLKHTSIYLPYMCVNDEKISKYGAVCLKKFPWLMDPQCHFLTVWKFTVSCSALITILIYPAFMAWYSNIPMWFFNFSCVISTINIIDVALQFTTAIKFKNILVQKFGAVVVDRVTRMLFMADIIAAIPLQVFMFSMKEEKYSSNIYFANAMAKMYLLLPLFYKLNYCPRPKAFFRTLVKFIVMLIILIYFSSCVLYLVAIECIFYGCGNNTWLNPLLGNISGVEVAILRAVHLGFEIPEEEIVHEVVESYIITWTFFAIYKHFYYALNGECVATYVLELTYDVEYRSRMTFVYEFLGKHKMVGNLRKRAMSTMRFQWSYDRNNYTTEKDRVWEDLSEALTIEVKQKFVYPLLANSKLFESESESFLMDLARRVTRLALPANSVLLTLGTQTSRLYIIQKGFVQINSFITGDLNKNSSRRIMAKRGDAFPVVDLLSQNPSAVSAVTISDCELLVLELEDLISELMIHGIFKDFVNTIQETDMTKLTTAKLGVSEYKDVFSEGGEPYKTAFKPFRILARILKFFLRKKPINSNSTSYLYWELTRVLGVLISVVGWPIALGCSFDDKKNKIIYTTLFALECMGLFDFYIRMQVAYYNKLGIYVSHTLCTAVHYISTAFIADFLAFTPNFHVVYIIVNSSYKDQDWKTYLIHIIMRSFALYRIVGFLKHFKASGKLFLRSDYFYVFFFVGLIVHYYSCIMVHLYVNNVLVPQFRLTVTDTLKLDSPLKYYLNELGLILTFIFKGARFINQHDVFTLVYASVASAVGLIARMCLTAHLILTCTTSSRTLTTYQYYMQSFINFLTRQKVDVKVSNQAAEYFEYDWEKTKGLKLHEIFKCLPQTLHEDILFPLYKRAFSGIVSLSGANEYFYRTLARFAEEMTFKEGSMITFYKEVQSNIYFIYSGQCLVQGTRQILYVGSVFGDIQNKGVMQSTILARTHIKLLKIPSRKFFMALNNSHFTKLAFTSEAASNQDFIASIFVEDLQVFPVEREEEECEFVTDAEEAEAEDRILKKKKRRFSFKRDSKFSQFLRFLFMLVAYCTVVLIPIFVAIRNFTPLFLSLIYILDFLWLVKIIAFSTMFGNQISFWKVRKYKKLVLGVKMLCNIISILPIEIIPLIQCYKSFSDTCCYFTCLCYVNRMCRVTYIFGYFKKKGKKLLMNFYMNVVGIIMLKIALINLSCAIRLSIHHMDVFEFKKCYMTLTPEQKDEIMFSYLCVLNDFIGAGMEVCLPYVLSQVLFQMFVSFWSFISKGYLISYVMMIIYVTHYNKSVQMVQLEELQHYLMMRDVSPILRTNAQVYFTNLLNSFSEGAVPVFLHRAPPTVRIAVMAHIYENLLKGCYLFRGLEDYFLKQLASRLNLNVFFPGDYIVQQGDVDHNIYFIQSGEVYCIQTDKQFTALEKAKELYYAGANFGAEQGVLAAWPHKYTFRAKTLTNLLVLNYFEWEDLRVAFPEIFDTIYNTLVHNQP